MSAITSSEMDHLIQTAEHMVGREQLIQLLELGRRHGRTAWQRILANGSLADLLEAPGAIDRRAFRDFLGLIDMPSTGLKIWKAIQLGLPCSKSGKELLKDLRRKNIRIDERAVAVLRQRSFRSARRPTMVHLVAPSVAELGFNTGQKYSDVCARAFKYGFEWCSVEAVPQLRRQYLDQPRGEYLIVATEPISASDDERLLLGVEHSLHNLWLHSNVLLPQRFWNVDTRFVFVCPQQLRLPGI